MGAPPAYKRNRNKCTCGPAIRSSRSGISKYSPNVGKRWGMHTLSFNIKNPAKRPRVSDAFHVDARFRSTRKTLLGRVRLFLSRFLPLTSTQNRILIRESLFSYWTWPGVLNFFCKGTTVHRLLCLMGCPLYVYDISPCTKVTRFLLFVGFSLAGRRLSS